MYSSLLLIKSIGVGLAVAAPVGPMSLLCMRRTLTEGWRRGLATGAGIAVGDAIYAAVAGLGLAGVSAFVTANGRWLHLAAGLCLVWLGLIAFKPKPAAEAAKVAVTGSPLAAFAQSILLTLTNPPTIIMFAAVFAALAPKGGLNALDAAATVSGVLIGSLLWWLVVVAGVSLFRHAVGERVRRWIDFGAGVFLTAFGALELRRAF
jgi:threonine/homoserine/homoserine lactone efflux protein